MRWINYFEKDEVRYETGTVLIFKIHGEERKAFFICYDTEIDRYIVKIQEPMRTYRYMATKDGFFNNIISITDKIDETVHLPKNKVKSDSKIDGLTLGWLWYIILMLVSVIFNNFIGLWIFISIIFFNWRSEKIEKEGHYIEW